MLGISKTTWGVFTLPVALDSIGMTACSLLVSGQLVFGVAAAGGAARLTIPAASDTSLLGGSFFSQGLVLDPPANTLGATASNAVEGKIGAK